MPASKRRPPRRQRGNTSAAVLVTHLMAPGEPTSHVSLPPTVVLAESPHSLPPSSHRPHACPLDTCPDAATAVSHRLSHTPCALGRTATRRQRIQGPRLRTLGLAMAASRASAEAVGPRLAPPPPHCSRDGNSGGCLRPAAAPPLTSASPDTPSRLSLPHECISPHTQPHLSPGVLAAVLPPDPNPTLTKMCTTPGEDTSQGRVPSTGGGDGR